MRTILELLPTPYPTIQILDLGAMAVASKTEYQRLIDLGIARVIGFEPVIDACEKLNRESKGTHQYYPSFIGDGSKRTFHLGRAPMTSSLYAPNLPLCRPFQALAELMETTSTSEVQTTRLDDLPDLPSIDYVKMDIQGAERDAIVGGARILRDAMVIESEVEFVPLYVDQPLFGDVDAALRKLDFLFHQFRGVAGRTLKPMVIGGDTARAMSQHLWADGVWLPHLLSLETKSPPKLIKMAIVLHEIYGSYDFAMTALRIVDQKEGSDLSKRYLELVMA